MGLLWWGGLVLGWVAIGWLGVSKMACNLSSGGELNRVMQKYGGQARVYKTNVGNRFG